MSFTRRGFPLLGLLCCAGVAMAQVDNSTHTGSFQLEGDATTANVCFLPPASGGPAIAVPGAAGSSGLDSNGCPTVKNVGSSSSPVPATWSLIQWGSGTTPPTPIDDWMSYAFNGSVFTQKSNSLFTPAFVTDPDNVGNDDTFLGTSSKDTMDISQWAWNPHSVQDKSDIEHAGASAYKLSNGHVAIYAFMDRYGNSGDSTAGFWFVQDSTFAYCTGAGQSSAGPNSACTAAGQFIGHHFDGDLLIVSDLSVGGAVSTINIFKWSGSGASGSLTGPVATLSPAPCDPTTGSAPLCGAVNNAFMQLSGSKGLYLSPVNVATGGWSFSCKGCSFNNQFETNTFLEISVDLNGIFGNNILCFSTFFSETRSSTSSTASLSDLTKPIAFPFCSLSVSAGCNTSTLVNGGAQIAQNFTVTVSNTGTATIYSPTLTKLTLPSGSLLAAADCPATAPSGYSYVNSPQTDGCLAVSSTGFTSTTIPNSGTSSIGGTFLTSALLGTGANVSASATASSSNTGTPQNVGPGSDQEDQAGCQPVVNAALTTNKKCDTCLTQSSTNGPLTVQLNEGVQYCNNASTDVTINSILIQDCRGAETSATNQTCPAGYGNLDTTKQYCCRFRG